MIKKNKFKNLKLKILLSAKKNVIFDGWCNNLLDKIAKDTKISVDDIYSIFPKGYRDILEYYLNEQDKNMILSISKNKLKRLKTKEKIYLIILTRLEQNKKEKDLIKRTIRTLALPKNQLLAHASLYRTVDNIWYISKDKSVDFNFYTKRLILSGMYISTLVYWLNDNSKDHNKTKIFLKKRIDTTKNISKIKNFFKKIIPFKEYQSSI